MNSAASGQITVMQVFSALGVRPTNEQAWGIGTRIAHLYNMEFGAEPPKALRPKTSGTGSHCFAIYPSEWFDRIAEVIQLYRLEDGKQDDLFGGTEDTH